MALLVPFPTYIHIVVKNRALYSTPRRGDRVRISQRCLVTNVFTMLRLCFSRLFISRVLHLYYFEFSQSPLNIIMMMMMTMSTGETRIMGLPHTEESLMLSRVDTIPEGDRQTDKRTDGRTDGIPILIHDNNQS